MMEPLLLTVPQVMEALQMGRTTVYSLIGRGELPVLRIGKSVRVRRVDLEKWLEVKVEEEMAAAPALPAWPSNRR